MKTNGGILVVTAERLKMSDCELLSTCPFFNDNDMAEMPDKHKEQYCQGDSSWCGRYLVYKALERELKRAKVHVVRI